MQRVFQAAAQNPLMLPADFMSYIVDFIQTQRLNIPIGQVIGFSGFTANFVDDGLGGVEQTTTSTTYVDPGTVTELSALGSGRYVVLWGGSLKNSVGAGTSTLIAPNINGVVTDNHLISSELTSYGPFGAGGMVATLNNGGGNTIKLQVRVLAPSTGTFARLWLMALRFANI